MSTAISAARPPPRLWPHRHTTAWLQHSSCTVGSSSSVFSMVRRSQRAAEPAARRPVTSTCDMIDVKLVVRCMMPNISSSRVPRPGPRQKGAGRGPAPHKGVGHDEDHLDAKDKRQTFLLMLHPRSSPAGKVSPGHPLERGGKGGRAPSRAPPDAGGGLTGPPRPH